VILLDPARQKGNQPRSVEKVRDRDRVKTIGSLSAHECLTEPRGGPHSLAVQTAAGQRGDLQNEPISNERAQPTSQSASIDVAGRVPKDLDLRQKPKAQFIHPIVRLQQQHCRVVDPLTPDCQ
jgi:hypothetical protein